MVQCKYLTGDKILNLKHVLTEVYFVKIAKHKLPIETTMNHKLPNDLCIDIRVS